MDLAKYRYFWSRRRPEAWALTLAQILDSTDDPERVFEVVEISPIMTGVVGKRIVIFRLTRFGSRKPAAASMYFEYGNGQILESANSKGFDGKETGDRIFFVDELQKVLPQADRLVVTVESKASSERPEKGGLWSRLKSWLSKSDPW